MRRKFRFAFYSVTGWLLLVQLCDIYAQSTLTDPVSQRLVGAVLNLMSELQMNVADRQMFECSFWHDVVLHANLCYAADNESTVMCDDYIVGYNDDNYTLPPLSTLSYQSTNASDYPQLCLTVGLVLNQTDWSQPGDTEQLDQPDVEDALTSDANFCLVTGDYKHACEEQQLLNLCVQLNTTGDNSVYDDNGDNGFEITYRALGITLLSAIGLVLLGGCCVLVWKFTNLRNTALLRLGPLTMIFYRLQPNVERLNDNEISFSTELRSIG